MFNYANNLIMILIYLNLNYLNGIFSKSILPPPTTEMSSSTDTECLGCDYGKCIRNNINNTFDCICNSGYKWNTLISGCTPSCNDNDNDDDDDNNNNNNNDDDDDGGDCKNNKYCLNGYEYKNLTNNKWECQPKCNPNCINGICIEPNVCKCNQGYWVQNALYNHICLPYCSESCINGNCSAPNKCTCNDGYIYKNDSKGLCESLCKVECKNGFCLDADTCECNDGYYKNSKNICEPMCSETCLNAECVEPELCECFNGYELKNNSRSICEPIECHPNCENGLCISKNVCDCYDGYQLSDKSIYDHWYLCEPICNEDNNIYDIDTDVDDDDGCINGTCIAPNQCQCYDDYELSLTLNFTCILKINKNVKEKEDGKKKDTDDDDDDDDDDDNNDIVDVKKSPPSVVHIIIDDKTITSCKWAKILSILFEGLFGSLVIFLLIFIYIRRKMQSGTYITKDPNLNNIEMIMDKWSND